MSCEGLDQDFKFNRSGRDKKRLRDFASDPYAAEDVVNKFSRIIQSGKPVILDGRCSIRVCIYKPPEDYVESIEAS